MSAGRGFESHSTFFALAQGPLRTSSGLIEVRSVVWLHMADHIPAVLESVRSAANRSGCSSARDSENVPRTGYGEVPIFVTAGK